MIDINLFKRLPQYYQKNDTYINSEGKGLLHRFLSVLDSYLSDLFDSADKVFGKDYNIVDPLKTDEEFIKYIADYYGNPPLLGDNIDIMYRKMLRHIVTIYHWRGTIHFYQVIFKYYGISIEMEEDFETSGTFLPHYDSDEYNTSLFYDVDDNKFDISEECLNCSTARVYAKPLSLSKPEILERLLKVLDLYRPINAIFEVWISYKEDAVIGDDTWVNIGVIDSEGIHIIPYEADNLLEFGTYYYRDLMNYKTRWSL